MAQIITYAPYNAVGDGQKVTTNASFPLNSNVLTVTNSIFSPNDVGKIIFVIRQDVYGGFHPWYGALAGYTGWASIIGYNTAKQVVLGYSCSTAPPTGTFVTQSWPYSNTPSLVLWGTDNWQAIQNALASGAGGDVFVPNGTFCFGHPLVIPSNTNFRGYSPNSVLMPLGVTITGGAWSGIGSSGYSHIIPALVNNAFVNVYLPNYRTSPIGNNNASNIIAASGDTNIMLGDMTIDISAKSMVAGEVVFRTAFLNNLTITNLTTEGNPYNGYEAPTNIACSNVNITNNTFNNCAYGYTPWAGTFNVNFSNNDINLIYNGSTSATYTLGQLVGIEINVVGTVAGDDQISSNFTISNNNITSPGAALNGLATAPIIILPDGPQSVIKNLTLENNNIYCTNSHNGGIYVFGGGNNITVASNYLEGSDGGSGSFIFWPVAVNGGTANTGAYTLLSSATSVSGSTSVQVTWPGNGYTGLNSGVAQGIFQPTAGPTVGGFSLNGWYPITQIIDNNNFIISIPSAATSSQTVAWNGAFAQIAIYPQNTTIKNNTLYNCQTSRISLFAVTGFGTNLINNTVQYSTNTSPNYSVCVEYNSLNAPSLPPGSILNNSFPSGSSLPAGDHGNTVIAWNQYSNPPSVVDSSSSSTNNFVGGGISLGSGGMTIMPGQGVPTSVQPAGSIYLRNNGSVGARIYISAGGGTWNPISGV